MKVEIYSKASCPLCEEAKRVVLAVRAKVPFELVEVDILSDPNLYDRFLYDVPVVFVNGERVFVHRVDAGALERRLRAS